MAVSIPLSEFCWLKPATWSAPTHASSSFNSPLGILLVEALPSRHRRSLQPPVSIPLSEFCWLKRNRG